ncbi:hypothetical protein ADK52_26025 [Streptomyces sp. WM6372]|uniref:hypothetical protein n=1 Tax=Streptomyces sp. WM6372 TaxID=1415555 RepID=UPI0006B00A75|nr:hypothetical protein [Streptomyces sp. WM6372]KOU20569.1 hypothetical protein ADK52_26025 [Streptomyces sp. WM6372]
MYDWFDPDIVEYTADALGVPADSGPLVRLPVIEPRPMAPTEEFRLRTLLRKDLLGRLGEENDATLRRAHRLAAAYYHQPLDPFNTDRIGWYVEQVRHLACCNPDRALNRLAAVSHTALLAGHPEAASRAAAAALRSGADTRELTLLAEVVRSVALILADQAEVDGRAIVRLDGLLAGSRPPRDLAAARIGRLARDLVTYYSERRAPAPTLTAALALEAGRSPERRGRPEVSASLSVAEEFAHFPHTVMRRDHMVKVVGRRRAHHSITSTLHASGDQSTHAVIDIFPWNYGETLDKLDIRDANGGVVPSLKQIEVQSYIANAVSFWLGNDSTDDSGDDGDDDGDTGPGRGRGTEAHASHREISLALSSAVRSRQHDTVATLLATATETTGGELGARILAATRYLPLVAELDTAYGTSRRLHYGYDGTCSLRRHGLLGVSAELELCLPTEARNQLAVPTPEGVELAGIGTSDARWAIEPAHAPADWEDEAPQGLPEQFVVRFGESRATESAEGEGPAGEGAHRVERTMLRLYYVPRRKDVLRVIWVNLFCLLVCLAATILELFVEYAEWSGVIPVAVVMASLLEQIQNRRQHPSGSAEALHTYASRRLNLINATGMVAALLATSALSVGTPAVSLSITISSLVVCLASTGALLASVPGRRHPLEARAASHALD